ncbi:MAG: low specificity L-threonine aldolase [Rhodobacteraceae bacterium]|nr:low specificity L-threonine aldolase [Paracoccaceae bacterium]
MHFASDNAGPVAPEIMDALIRANDGHAMAYGTDHLTQALESRLRELFEAPEARVFLLTTGTATNVLALATLTDPWQSVFCHRDAHIEVSECNAPEFYTGGAKLIGVDGPTGKIDPGALRSAMASLSDQASPDTRCGTVSLTQVTDLGGVYTLDHIRAVTDIAREFGVPAHMDGARFANALVELDCSPAGMTWRAGIDALSFGGTKNGLMSAEAVIFFNPAHAYEFEHRRRRGAHLSSKQRYIAAQYLAYLDDGLWLDLARRANRAAARLEAGLKGLAGVTLVHPREANMLFTELARPIHARLRDAGAVYYASKASRDDHVAARLVTNWATTDADVDAFLAIVRSEG